ncbi:MAG: hypothetical protein C0505_15715 [Leptothrix sp. (in: Bacteria)]|nr:hypothetical protein [Leptothrix sp. (in: b-proteobacteria)]
MTQAADLLSRTSDPDAAQRAAEILTDLVEHVGERTLFTFDDDSVLVVDGHSLLAFDGFAAARSALGG